MHIVTVNDYLASRDAEWMGRVYRFLGLSVGVNLSQSTAEVKQQAYAADITYGTNNEFGFDYLRDNMAMQVADRYQRRLNYGIVDEVDSILIDEARTPLIISGQAEDHTELYYQHERRGAAARCAQKEEDGPRATYSVDEKDAPGAAVGSRAREGRGDPRAHRPAAAGRQPVRARLHQPDAPPVRRAARARTCSTATSTTSCRTAKW